MKNRPKPGSYVVCFLEQAGALYLRQRSFRSFRKATAALCRHRSEIGKPFRANEIPPAIRKECGLLTIRAIEIHAIGKDGLRRVVLSIGGAR